ncbi:MAG: hypothetical protein CMF62_00830 [Magnetococcales bacterium]|nr:hypothetical protein [Magnetococcales bacterium]|tara:strand:+ start:3814 stop:4530 length:717 start_codon:yes stop_codon:yes gene_type:complete
MSMCLVIQSVDPYGYNGMLPDIVEALFSNFATDIGLVIVFLFMGKFLKVISYMEREDKLIAIIGSSVTFILTIIFSFLQAYVNHQLFRGVKLITLGVVTFLSTFVLNYLFLRVIRFLTNIYVRNLDAPENPELNKLINKLKTYVGIFDFVILIVICFQLYAGIQSIKNYDSIHNPHITIDMILFPIAQFFGIIMVIAFTWNKVNEYNNDIKILKSFFQDTWRGYVETNIFTNKHDEPI